MNKQELIEQIEGLKKLFGNKSEYVEIDTVIRLISELDKQQEVEIPMFVADFITEQKKLGYTLSYSIDACMSDRVAEWYWDNSELFALSWVNGYTVEKEKRYLVKMKGMDKEFTMLKLDKIRGIGIWGMIMNIATRKPLTPTKSLKKLGLEKCLIARYLKLRRWRYNAKLGRRIS